MEFSSTGKIQVRSERCCVLYDPADGTIRHIHHVVTMEGAEETAPDMIEKRTFQLARECGIDATKLQSLQVEGRDLEQNMTYAVDTGNRRLITVDAGKAV